MIEVFIISAAVILISIALAFIRLIIGPTIPDRIVGLDTINTLVIVGMILFGAAFKESIYIDVAIVYALLSFVTTMLVAKYLEGGRM
ncbi:MAG: cation:proton antiporter [Thermoplasmata archaeon]|nr:MAG: cation:proton antiporter [Thermoplasmata archaeon]MCD6468932.1 cation:proton antiporter [Thermoplasmata archaeon]RLF27041.1 MAG: cation:proton antiporter [Thermoplasmata archaeon]